MAEDRRVTVNAFANVAQMLTTAVLLFALYRYVSATLGVDQLGVWSVVMATASASRLADLGLGAGVTRFVARDCARSDAHRAAQVIDTAVLTLAAGVGLGLFPLYALVVKLLPYLFDGSYQPQALEILPIALASLWLAIISAVFQSGLDGCQRMGLRAGLVVVGQALLLALALWLVPEYGLVGLAWAQIGQGLFLVLAGRSLLRWALPGLNWVPRRWRKNVLLEMLGYGVNLQAASVMMLLVDPVTKAMMARFGGPTAAGHFEIANQVVLKARAVIVAANQAIVPHVAVLAESDSAGVERVYRDNMRVLAFVTLPMFALLVIGAPMFSRLLIGSRDLELISLICLLALTWTLNIFAVPAYFANLGTGRVGWNTISHAIMGVLNAALAWFLGAHYGANGVVFAYVFSIIVGSWPLVAAFHRAHKLNWACLLPAEHLWLLLACTTAGLVGWFAPLGPAAGQTAATMAMLSAALLFLLAAIWFHPLRENLWRRLWSVSLVEPTSVETDKAYPPR